MENNFTTEEIFDSAVSIVRNLPKEGAIKPSDDLKLKLYALYKQATHGPNDTRKPRFYQVVELYKWDAWKKLDNMSKEEAMRSYIRELEQIMDTIPAEEADEENSKRFENVLGKTFYDYWFKRWTSAKNSDDLGSRELDKSECREDNSENLVPEENQCIDEGYRTPNEFESDSKQQVRDSITSQLIDHFSGTLMRLRLGLDSTRRS